MITRNYIAIDAVPILLSSSCKIDKVTLRDQRRRKKTFVRHRSQRWANSLGREDGEEKEERQEQDCI